MQIAIMLYDQLAALDAVGPYEVLSRLPGADLVTVGETTGTVRSDTGTLGLVIDATYADIPRPDVIVVPGGPGKALHLTAGPTHQWLRTADTTSTWTTSVCTGSLILAAAGLLTGRRATTHWQSLNRLADHGAIPVRERVVTDGKYVTGAGVSAGIDMALTLAAHIAGDTIAQRLQLAIEYDPQPPFNAGSPTTAPTDILAAFTK
jgi:transcriptional regulator GlxA family with amidase domain